MKQTFYLLISFSLIVMSSFYGCSIRSKIRIYEEQDIVKNSQRFRKDLYSFKIAEKNTPLVDLKKTFIKEVTNENVSSLKVYDFLTFSMNSFALENTVYLIADADVIPFGNLQADVDLSSSISENRENILTADSSSVSVVTGYTTYQHKLLRFHYEMDTVAQSKILNAKNVAFRYYAGPSMMTAKVHRRDLKFLKELILSK